MRNWETAVEMLRTRARTHPRDRAVTFLPDDYTAVHLSFSELDRRARTIAGSLQERAEPGARLMLLYPPGLEYVAAFFGCLYAGMVAVPVYPPRLNRSRNRPLSIALDSNPSLILTTHEWAVRSSWMSECPWIATDTIEAVPWREPAIGRSTLAMLQYTSGSTGDPKGVMLSHGNILSNLEQLEDRFPNPNLARSVSWLPPYHDMGLIGSILLPIYGGWENILLSPFSFLQRPLRWLEALSRYHGVMSAAPNFAYDLCVRRIPPDQRSSLDLSHWKVAINGAEPVRAATLRRFEQAFGPSGFRPEAFRPSYGLAEATLLVASGIGPDLVDSTDRVGCGAPASGVRLAIVDPDTGELHPNGVEGEIRVSGPNVACGYWGKSAESDRVFRAPLGGTPFLRTGDLGFLRNGELTVTGRLKDLIIVDGRNHHPGDIEATAESSHASLRSAGCAAFSFDFDGEERVGILAEAELRADPEEIAGAIRKSVAREHDLRVQEVLILPPGRLPKTSSGKVQRGLCREEFLALQGGVRV